LKFYLDHWPYIGREILVQANDWGSWQSGRILKVLWDRRYLQPQREKDPVKDFRFLCIRRDLLQGAIPVLNLEGRYPGLTSVTYGVL
jgi:hypothetical protein